MKHEDRCILIARNEITVVRDHLERMVALSTIDEHDAIPMVHHLDSARRLLNTLSGNIKSDES